MRTTAASVIAGRMVIGPRDAAAQEAQPPVEATEVPENEATNPQSQTGKLPLEGRCQPIAATPATAPSPGRAGTASDGSGD